MPQSNQKYAIEKYIDQVKVLTTLASALLFSPGILATIFSLTGDMTLSDQVKQQVTIAVLISSGSSLIAILLAYFIYSSLIGMIYHNEYNLYRPTTRILSILQFFLIIISCISFIYLIYSLLTNH